MDRRRVAKQWLAVQFHVGFKVLDFGLGVVGFGWVVVGLQFRGIAVAHAKSLGRFGYPVTNLKTVTVSARTLSLHACLMKLSHSRLGSFVKQVLLLVREFPLHRRVQG